MITSIPKSQYAIHSRLQRTDETKVVAVNKDFTIYDTLNNLDKFFAFNDVIVVNDSAVIPGSFQAIHYPTNIPIEFRLVRFLGKKKTDFKKWQAIIYGKGNWTTATENRLPPPDICLGDLLLAGDLIAEVIDFVSTNKRLIIIEFHEPDSSLLNKIYTNGKMIQYSYLKDELKVWDHQTLFSCYPVSIEPSSAVFQLNWDLIFKLQMKGIKIIPITHSISISNTGIRELDNKLPFPERYWLSEKSAEELNEAMGNNCEIIAFGTSVTRSLESIMTKNKRFTKGSDNVELVIDENYQLKVTNGLLTGMHMMNESHINLLQAFLPLDKIKREYDLALKKNFLWHEYGDSMLIKNFQ